MTLCGMSHPGCFEHPSSTVAVLRLVLAMLRWGLIRHAAPVTLCDWFRAGRRTCGRALACFAIVGGSGAGITAVDSVLVDNTGQSPGASARMSDPAATIARRLVYPFQSPIREQFQSPIREQRRSG